MLVVDGSSGLTHQDVGLAKKIEAQGKSVIVAVNKCDLGPSREDFQLKDVRCKDFAASLLRPASLDGIRVEFVRFFLLSSVRTGDGVRAESFVSDSLGTGAVHVGFDWKWRREDLACSGSGASASKATSASVSTSAFLTKVGRDRRVIDFFDGVLFVND